MALGQPILLLVVVALATMAVNDTSNQLALELATIPVFSVYKRENNVTGVYLGSDVSQPDIQNRFGSEHERRFASTYSNESASSQWDSVNAPGMYLYII